MLCGNTVLGRQDFRPRSHTWMSKVDLIVLDEAYRSLRVIVTTLRMRSIAKKVSVLHKLRVFFFEENIAAVQDACRTSPAYEVPQLFLLVHHANLMDPAELMVLNQFDPNLWKIKVTMILLKTNSTNSLGTGRMESSGHVEQVRRGALLRWSVPRSGHPACVAAPVSNHECHQPVAWCVCAGTGLLSVYFWALFVFLRSSP